MLTLLLGSWCSYN